MKKHLFIALILFASSCTQDIKENSLLCEEIKGLNIDIEDRIVKLYDRVETISRIFNVESFQDDFERSKKIHSLFSSMSVYLEKNKETEIEKLLPKIHAIIDEIRSVTPFIDQYLETDYKPMYWLTHEELNSIKKLNDCNEINQYKLNIIEEKLLMNCGELHMNTFHFNAIKPVAYSNESDFIKNDSFLINVGFFAYDTTRTQHIKYWIDDSTYNQETEIRHTGSGPISIKIEKGKHTISGVISIMEKGIEKYKPWRYQYEGK